MTFADHIAFAANVATICTAIVAVVCWAFKKIITRAWYAIIEEFYNAAVSGADSVDP